MFAILQVLRNLQASDPASEEQTAFVAILERLSSSRQLDVSVSYPLSLVTVEVLTRPDYLLLFRFARRLPMRFPPSSPDLPSLPTFLKLSQRHTTLRPRTSFTDGSSSS